MIELRRAETDEDLEAWRRVRLAVLPNERTETVTELRSSPRGRVLLVAYAGGELAGSGVLARADTGGVFVQPRVLPGQRRRGVGSTLLRALAGEAAAGGHTEAGAHVEDAGSLGFAERFGFRETDRQVEQVRAIAVDETAPPAVPGIELVPLAGRPDLADRIFDELAREAVKDFAVDSPIEIDAEAWKTEWLRDTSACFVALDDGAIVGLAGFERDADRPERGENAMTAVRRDRRGRGIARALKLAAIRLAAEQGLTELYTWTQERNVPMRRLNSSLGYVDRGVSITVRGALPLP
jgi:GNAT superfamily N-acetyltransferase